ncbi:MAG: DJ-1/PfpI family protein [archaeon]
MVKVLFVIAQHNFQDKEFSVPKDILESKGFEVVVASVKKGECVGMFGSKATADVTIDEVNSKDYDALVLVGGSGAIVYVENKKVLSLVKEMNTDNKIVAAICIAPVILAKSGLLEGKKATVYNFPLSKQYFSLHNVKKLDDNVVVDGNIITGNGPKAAEEFGNAIAEKL